MMAIGPGKYDAECTRALEATGAVGCILAVIDGRRGSGFSCQAPLEIVVNLPDILRKLADSIEADRKRGIP